MGRRNLWTFYLFLFLVACDIAAICGIALYCVYRDLVGRGHALDLALCCAVGSGAVIVLLPVVALLALQTSNFMRNTTTHERYSANSTLQTASCLRNCFDMCCDIQTRVCEAEDIHSKSGKDTDELARPLL